MEFSFVDNQVVPGDKFETVVPKDFHGLYVKGDEGDYKLGSDHEGVKAAVAAVTRLNQALKASRAEAKNFKGMAVDLSPLGDYGKTPEEIAENIAAKIKEAGKGKTAEDMQRQIEKIKSDLATAHKSELDAAKARAEALRGQLHKRLVTTEAVTALAEANAVDPDIVLPFLSNQVKVDEQDGEFKVQVVDKAGDIRYSGVTGAPMTIKELVGEMRQTEKYAPLFKSENRSGGGTTQSRVPGATQLPKTGTDKIASALNRRK